MELAPYQGKGGAANHPELPLLKLLSGPMSDLLHLKDHLSCRLLLRHCLGVSKLPKL
jgi:hypothetical protein